MEQEGKMSEKRFTTDDIVATVMKWRGWDMDAVDEPAYKEIIARLRAADKLCEAAREYLAGGEEFQGNDLDKAIADYEGLDEDRKS